MATAGWARCVVAVCLFGDFISSPPGTEGGPAVGSVRSLRPCGRHRVGWLWGISTPKALEQPQGDPAVGHRHPQGAAGSTGWAGGGR